MKSLAARILFSVSLALILAPGSLAQQTSQTKTLNNAAVVKLAKAGFKEKTIISIINARVPNFDLSADRMIELKRNGVSEKIIVAMLARQEGMNLFDDESWSDEEFMSKGLDRGAGNNSGGTSSDPGTSIFGSSGGSKGQTRSNMGNGGAENDVVTTGSATVRILKPPTEAGGTDATKLEKTKSLTNESIVELVEAGFSEGTIIRRIEQSPVEFDLTAAKLEELRKRRVSDRVVAAMKAAMGEDK
ncbi:MAG TPA: hypothetical protein VFY67_18095 [Pyrinomonadaceae bacterium]|nr:hypothetical protein [Pyrinomonadaceae bacterium]